MNRTGKIITGLIGCAAVATAASGVAVATTSSALSPVTLCVAKGGGVSAPSSGNCSPSQTKLQVASNSDVQALANRLDNDEATVATLRSELNQLESEVGILMLTVTGPQSGLLIPFHAQARGLAPGSAVMEHVGDDTEQQIGPVVGSDGSWSVDASVGCFVLPMHLVGTSTTGATITSPAITIAQGSFDGCP